MLNSALQQLALGDVTATGIVAAQNHWPYHHRFSVQDRATNQLYLQLSGTRQYRTNEISTESFEVNAGDLVLMPLHSSYSTVVMAESGAKSIAMLFLLFSSTGESILLENQPRIVAHDHDLFYQTHMTKLLHFTLQGGYAVLKAKELLYSILYQLAMDHGTFLNMSTSHQRILPALQYMESHLQGTIKVDEMASLCYMSKSSFFRLFQKAFHETPTNYHLSLRIRKSCELLESGLYSAEQVASIMGFYDTSYFCRVLYRITGKHASELRRSGREN